MKKAIVFVLASVLCLSLVGCSSSSSDETEAATTATPEEKVEEESEAISEIEDIIALEETETDVFSESEIEQLMSEDKVYLAEAESEYESELAILEAESE